MTLHDLFAETSLWDVMWIAIVFTFLHDVLSPTARYIGIRLSDRVIARTRKTGAPPK